MTGELKIKGTDVPLIVKFLVVEIPVTAVHQRREQGEE